MIREGAAVFLLIFAVAASGYAQAETPELTGGEPENPVFWWTLTDELSPKELRAIHENAELHRVRYLQAVEAGYRDPLPEDRLKAITSFFTGTMTPELFPLWRAFDAFSTYFYEDDRWEAFAVAPKMLAKYGLEGAVAETIIHYTLRQLDESQDLVREFAPDTLLLMDLAREAGAKAGLKAVKESLDRRDGELIAEATGRNPAFIARLIETWQRAPIRETAVFILPELRDKLSPADWERFRLFLLKEVAPKMSTIDFAHEGE